MFIKLLIAVTFEQNGPRTYYFITGVYFSHQASLSRKTTYCQCTEVLYTYDRTIILPNVFVPFPPFKQPRYDYRIYSTHSMCH